MCGVTALTLGGLILSAAATGATTFQQSQQAQFQAEQLEDEARAQETAAALRAEDRERRRLRALAEQRVRFGASGFEVDADILATTAEEFSREQFADTFNVNRQIQSLQGNAASARASGRNALTSGVINFGGSAADTLINARAG